MVWMQGEKSGKQRAHREEKHSKGKTERRTSKRLEKRSKRGESSAAQRGKSAAERRMVRRTFKMLREVWLNIGVEKIDTHEGVIIKVLLDSSTTGMFIDRQMAARHGFKLQKLERPLLVKNVDGTNNSGGAITH